MEILGDLFESAPVGMFSLGLAPVISAFLLVEVVALVVPRWRRLRTTGTEGRSRLGMAIVFVTIVLATVQAWWITSYLGDSGAIGAMNPEMSTFHVGLGWRIAATASLVGGSFLLILLAAMINRFGLGNGYVAVFLASMLIEAKRFVFWSVSSGMSATSLGWFIVFAAAVVGLTTVLLRIRLRKDNTELELPTCGFVPLEWAISLGALVGI